ncbi:MAG TPA: ABC transporter permease [Vicinamibacterales bacterium]
MRDLPRQLVALASRLVPHTRRREFRAEWEAELAIDPSARRAFGAVPDAWFLFRQQWSLAMISQDLRYALRLLVRRPVYAITIVLTLAIGIGATTAMFSVIQTVLLRPLPFRDPSRLVMVWENDRLNRRPRYPVAPANFDDWRTQAHGFERMAAWRASQGPVDVGGESFYTTTAVVTTNFFDTLGTPPMLGRGFARGDEPPAQRVLVISHAAWMTHFGGDRNVIDRVVHVGDSPYRIVGVMPPDFAFPDRSVDVWRPLAERPELMSNRSLHMLSVVARLDGATTFERARQNLETVAAGAQRAYPATNDQRGTTMVGLQDAIVGDVRPPLVYLGAAVVLVLLICCVNTANLMLAQAAARRREIAVRAALGAGRAHIVRQLLAEGLLLAMAGGTLGLSIAWLGTGAIARLAVDYVPRISRVGVDLPVLVFAGALSIVTGLLFTLLPALRASHTDVQQDLRAGARGATAHGRRLRSALVVAELTAAVVLVAGGMLLFESFRRVLQVDPGFAVGHVVSIDPRLPQARYQTAASLAQFYADLTTRVTALPGVEAAGAINNVPLTGDGWTSWLTIENRPVAGEPPEVGYRQATPGYLSVMRIPLLKGRWISATDSSTAQPIVVVNKALADRFFADGNAVGARIRLGPNPKAAWRTIVGIIGNVRHSGPEQEALPEAYNALAQDTTESSFLVRGDLDRGALVSAIRAAVTAVDPTVAVDHVQWLDTLMDDHLAPRRLAMALVEGFAGVALALALLGIYGVVSYAVTQRVPEIGVRIALGAAPGEILRMVLRDGLRLALPGLAAGTAIAIVVARLARSALFGVSPADPFSYATVLGVVLAVAMLASYVPARRAARVDPLRAIRVE